MRRKRASAVRGLRFALFAAAVTVSAAAAGAFRFARPVETPGGWSRLDLPDDVLDACRPGLPDLRLTDGAGHDIPYALARSAGGRELRRALTDVESTPHRETVALLDRGDRPGRAGSADVEIPDEDFLKPVVLEASHDRNTFREIARGSLFGVSGARSTTLRFPPNDRRFWRFRFDDRNGDPIHPIAVRTRAAGIPGAIREIPAALGASGDGASAIRLSLPAANLGVAALRFSVEDPAYERRVQVFERVFFRGEVSRRLIGAGTIRRSPGGAPDNDVAICDPANRNLEVEFENGDSPPLRLVGVTALATPPRLLFFSRGGMVTLLYGSPSALAPRYDLTSALAAGVPASVKAAALGAPKEIGSPAPVSTLPRGRPLETTSWKSRQAIAMPASDVAYLDLPDFLARQLPALRIVDGENRPVPHIVESGARQTVRRVTPNVSQKESRTIVEISGLDPSQPPDAVTLAASGPDYFSRDAVVLEQERDARGVTGDRFLGSAHWERRPGDASHPLTVSISAPRARSLRIEIENGDNAALTIARAEIRIPFVRVDFVAGPGEKLSLLSENPEAVAPRYDLAMVADRVLAAPALEARLAPAARTPEAAGLPKWFWAAVAAAALLVTAALVRTIKDVGDRT